MSNMNYSANCTELIIAKCSSADKCAYHENSWILLDPCITTWSKKWMFSTTKKLYFAMQVSMAIITSERKYVTI